MHRPVVERSAELELDTAGALRALTDPEVLSEWLGRWDATEGDDHGGAVAVVTTDDGVRRTVTDLEVGPSGVSWRWAPTDRTDSVSEVSIGIERVDDRRTLVTVTEVDRSHDLPTVTGSVAHDRGTDAGGPVGLDGIKWSICLLVLQIASSRPTVAA